MSTPAQQLKIRRIVWTTAIAAITMTGVWYGAGLKIQREFHTEVTKQREATPAELIKVLEQQRGALIAKRMDLERKLQRLEMKSAVGQSEGTGSGERVQGRERKRTER